MNVTIFGASGGTGLQLIDQVINKGHTVIAFCTCRRSNPVYPAGIINSSRRQCI